MSLFTKDFSDEEMARDWTLSELDLKQISTVISSYRLYFAIQLCSIRLQGGFLTATSELSPRIINYLSSQLDLPLTFFVNEPTRRATRSKQHGQILMCLGFKKYDRETNIILNNWIVEKAEQGLLPKDILKQSEEFLVWQKVVLPSRKMLERQVGSLCAKVHSKIFETIYERIPSSLKRSLNEILVSEDNQVSFFSLLKESPPAAKISSLKTYLERYKKLEEITLEHFDSSSFNSSFTDYLFGLAKY